MLTHNYMDELKKNMKNKRRQIRKTTYNVILFIYHFRVWKSNWSMMIKTRLAVAWASERITLKQHKESFWHDGNALSLDQSGD